MVPFTTEKPLETSCASMESGNVSSPSPEEDREPVSNAEQTPAASLQSGPVKPHSHWQTAAPEAPSVPQRPRRRHSSEQPSSPAPSREAVKVTFAWTSLAMTPSSRKNGKSTELTTTRPSRGFPGTDSKNPVKLAVAPSPAISKPTGSGPVRGLSTTLLLFAMAPSTWTLKTAVTGGSSGPGPTSVAFGCSSAMAVTGGTVTTVAASSASSMSAAVAFSAGRSAGGRARTSRGAYSPFLAGPLNDTSVSTRLRSARETDPMLTASPSWRGYASMPPEYSS